MRRSRNCEIRHKPQIEERRESVYGNIAQVGNKFQ